MLLFGLHLATSSVVGLKAMQECSLRASLEGREVFAQRERGGTKVPSDLPEITRVCI